MTPAGQGVGGPLRTYSRSHGAAGTIRAVQPTGIGVERLSLNQATVKHLDLGQAVALCVRHGIPAIGLWRDRVAEAGLPAAAAMVRAAGLHVSSLCRGGFFTHADRDARQAALADNRAAIVEAAELGADALVLVCGGLAGGGRDLGLARRMVADAIGELVPDAQRLGVRLGIEALHPMFCADRCVISSLGEAVDLALTFPADAVGVVVDTYHVWWDARLASEIARAGTRIVRATSRWRSSTPVSGRRRLTARPPRSWSASPPRSAGADLV